MKTFSFFRLLLTMTLTTGLSSLTASADTYLFNNGAGGDGTWENGAGGTPWKDGSTQNLPWDNTLNNIATFQSTGGTVDVEGPITANSLVFNASSAETLNGTGVITTISGNNVLTVSNNNNVTIDNDLQLDDSIASDRFDIFNNGTGTTTINGNISFVGSTTNANGQALILNTKTGSNIVFNGGLSGTATNAARIALYGTGTLTLTGDNSGTNATKFLEVDQTATAILASSNNGTGAINMFGSGPGLGATVLTSGAQTISNSITLQNISSAGVGYETVGGSTADISTFSGNITMVQSGVQLTAVDGGRVVVSGAITTSSTGGLVKIGAGTVVLGAANTYAMNAYGITPAGTVAGDVKQGTLLIKNTTGSAFGNNTGTVNIEAGGTLGGDGFVGSTHQVIATDATSVIAPGDAGQANLGLASSIGTLHLSDGLVATNGLTMDFKIDGLTNDSIDFGGSSFNLNGVVTINLTGTPTIDASNNGEFKILTGLDLDDSVVGSGLVFNFNAPTGYQVVNYDSDGTGGNGYIYVQLAATPEPSTYALLLAGGAGLLFLARRRRANA